MQKTPNFFLFLALAILGNESLVSFIPVSAGSRSRARDNRCGHTCRSALLVDFMDFNGSDILKEEKRYVDFFGDKVVKELGDLIGVHNFGANFAHDTA